MNFYKLSYYEINNTENILLNLNCLNVIFTNQEAKVQVNGLEKVMDANTVILVNNLPKVNITCRDNCLITVFSINKSIITNTSLTAVNPSLKISKTKYLKINDEERSLLIEYLNLIQKESKMTTDINNAQLIVSLINIFLNHLQHFFDKNIVSYTDSNNNRLSQSQIAASIKVYIDLNYTKNISLQIIADEFYLNPSYLSRIFSENYQIGISKYICQLRIEKAKQLLVSTNHLITYIASECGFNSVCNFKISFKREILIPPSLYRKIHAI